MQFVKSLIVYSQNAGILIATPGISKSQYAQWQLDKPQIRHSQIRHSQIRHRQLV